MPFVTFGSTNGSDRILLNEKAKSLTYRLKSKGLKLQPWRTPLAYWKDRVWLFPILTEEVEFEYKLLITLQKFPRILIFNSLYRSPSCQTESNAFLKSTKHAYTFVWWQLAYLSINVRSVRTCPAVQLFARKPIWDLWSMSSDWTCSRSLWLRMEQNSLLIIL